MPAAATQSSVICIYVKYSVYSRRFNEKCAPFKENSMKTVFFHIRTARKMWVIGDKYLIY